MSCPKTGQVSVAVLRVSREPLIFSFWLMLKHKRTDHPDVVTVWAKLKNNRAAQQWIKKPREKKWESLLDTMLLLLSHFSRVRLCMTPQTAAHQAPPSLGFSRQEHWSGVPFPSPQASWITNNNQVLFRCKSLSCEQCILVILGSHTYELLT